MGIKTIQKGKIKTNRFGPVFKNNTEKIQAFVFKVRMQW